MVDKRSIDLVIKITIRVFLMQIKKQEIVAHCVMKGINLVIQIKKQEIIAHYVIKGINLVVNIHAGFKTLFGNSDYLK